MKKILLLLLLLSSFLSAAIITNVSLLDNKNKCIYNDYYNKGGKFYYHYVSNDRHYSTTGKKYTSYIKSGYQFDTNTSVCSPEQWLILGMDVKDFHFLEAMTGLLFGFLFMFFTIELFTKVGTRR